MKAFAEQPGTWGVSSSVPYPSDCVMAVFLTAGVPKTVAVPQDANIVMFNATGNIWVRFGAAAAVPTADITDGTAPELNPAGRIVTGVASIGLAAATPCVVSLSFYR